VLQNSTPDQAAPQVRPNGIGHIVLLSCQSANQLSSLRKDRSPVLGQSFAVIAGKRKSGSQIPSSTNDARENIKSY
jgi:hypothetical protein